jgi:hypothetical protein
MRYLFKVIAKIGVYPIFMPIPFILFFGFYTEAVKEHLDLFQLIAFGSAILGYIIIIGTYLIRSHRIRLIDRLFAAKRGKFIFLFLFLILILLQIYAIYMS